MVELDAAHTPLSLNKDARFVGAWKYSGNAAGSAEGTEVTLHYDATRASDVGLAEEDLKLFQYRDGMWKTLPAAVDVDADIIVGRTDRLTTFAVGSDLAGLPLGWYALSYHYSFDAAFAPNAGMTDAQRIAHWKAPLVEAAAEGWDFVMVYAPFNYGNYSIGGKTYDIAAYLDEAESLGVKVMVDITLGTGKLPTPEMITAHVNAVKDHPALYGYYLIDEPEMREKPPYNVNPEECIAAYQLIKSLDPDGLVHITMSESITRHRGYLDAADVVAKELYTDWHWDQVAEDIKTCQSAGKPLMIVPNLFIGQGAYARTLQTAEEFQYNIFKPVLLGAGYANGSGVFPFLFEGFAGTAPGVDPPSSPTFREDLCYPSTRLYQAITPHMIAGTNSGCEFDWVGSSQPKSADFKSVLLGGSNDDMVLLVLNDSETPATRSFRITGLDPAIRQARRMDADGVVSLGDKGEINDQTFDAFEIKIYRLKAR